MRCRVSTVALSARHRRHLARTHNEGASARCVKAEDTARGVEGRRGGSRTYARCTKAVQVGGTRVPDAGYSMSVAPGGDSSDTADSS